MLIYKISHPGESCFDIDVRGKAEFLPMILRVRGK